MYKLYQKSSQYHNVRTRVFPPINPSSTHYKAFLFFLSLLYQNYIVLGLFYNPTNRIFSYSLSLSLSLYFNDSSSFFFFFFFFFATLLGAWCLGAEKMWESKGKQIFFFLLILVCSLNIYMILSFFFCFGWCLGVEKRWESKKKQFFFFDLFDF